MEYNKLIYIASWLIGLVILAVGLQSLHNIFASERDDARAELLARQNALSQFAVKSLKQHLHNRLKFAHSNISRIIGDPLTMDKGLFYFNQGEQLLPRPIQYLPGNEQKAKAIYEWVKIIEPLDLVIEKATPWEERLQLLSNFKLAVDDDNNDEIRWSFREIREHRARGNVKSIQDIPFMIAVVEYFIENSSPSKAMLQGVIRDGSIIEREHGMFGLQRSLLSSRNQFTHMDYIFLRDKIVNLSKYLDVRFNDFLDQSMSSTERFKIDNINAAVVNFSSKLYLEPSGEELLGITVDFDSILVEVKQEMIFLNLISDEDTLELPSLHGEFSALANLNINIMSDTWEHINSEISELYWLKTTLLAATAMLALVIVFLAGIIHYRKNRALALKYDFISTVSHELRTPLASLRLLSETLERRWRGNENIQDYPKRIVHVIDDLHLLIENILSFNRLTKNTWQPKLSRIVLKEIVDSVVYELTPCIELPLEVNTSELGDVEVSGDMELLKMLFRNLISNSCKYNTSEKVVIAISVGKHETEVETKIITYQDNGIGIPQSQWKLVFTEFTRYLGNGCESISGTGLGLAICKKVMAIHQGDIYIKDSDKQGTRFVILFP